MINAEQARNMGKQKHSDLWSVLGDRIAAGAAANKRSIAVGKLDDRYYDAPALWGWEIQELKNKGFNVVWNSTKLVYEISW